MSIKMKCKLCKEENIENKHEHMFEKHPETATKLFSYIYKRFAEPNMHGGHMKQKEGYAKGIYEPDEEMYAAFERGSNMGLAKLDELVSEYFSDEKK
jgi:hypothetical protein